MPLGIEHARIPKQALIPLFRITMHPSKESLYALSLVVVVVVVVVVVEDPNIVFLRDWTTENKN